MRFFLFLYLILLCGCNSSSHRISLLSEKERVANKIMKDVAINLSKEWGLIPCGSAGQMMDEIQMLGLSFNYLKPLGIQQGREILIDAVDKFNAAINNDEIIRPYLGNYPFEPKNILIEIFIYSPNYQDVEPGRLIVITASQGILKYDMRGLASDQWIRICKETYEEAVQKIKSKH